MLTAIVSHHPFFALFVLAMVVPIGIGVTSSLKPHRAAILVVFGTVLLVPESAYFKPPSVPYLNKNNLPYIAILLGLLISHPKIIWRAKPGSWPDALVFVSMVGALLTAAANPDPLVYGSWSTTVLPGLTMNDGFFMALTDAADLLLAFFVGRAIFRSSESLRDLARILVGMMLLYSVFIIWEARMSPQLHNTLYGYRAHHDFLQTIRWGGYRPMVFMKHGLALALLVMNTTLLAIGLRRNRDMPELPMQLHRYIPVKLVVPYLIIILVVCKSTGAIFYGLLFFPVVWRFKPKNITKVAFVFGLTALVYPALSTAELFPHDTLVEAFSTISEERAASMEFRFNNEEDLLEKARERVWFGWGEYGRNLLYDTGSGKNVSVTDGYWIILVGIRGVVGYTAVMVLILYPVLIAPFRIRSVLDRRDRILIACLTMMQAASAVDLIPNGLFSTYPLFIAGALTGLYDNLPKQAPGSAAAPPRKKKRRPRSPKRAAASPR